MNKVSDQAINLAFYGPEHVPPAGIEMSDMERVKAFNWYGYNCDVSDARQYLTDLLIKMERKEDVKVLRSVPDAWVNNTAAWLARLVMLGADLPTASLEFLNRAIDKMLEHATYVEAKAKTNGDKPNIQERIRAKNSDFIARLEELIDTGVPEDWSMYAFLKEQAATPLMAAAVARKFQPYADELVEAFSEGADPQLVEAYANYSETEIASLAELFAGIIEDSLRFAATEKKIRAPRKKKAPSTEKLLRYFKYGKAFPEMKIASIDPAKIIGAQELWTFNWKSKVMTVFRARSRDGLTVNRSSIAGYDIDVSQSKRIGRKTQELVDSVLNGGKVALRKLMDGVNVDPIKPTRMNEQTILLRVL
jgi:hypothetical protein